MRPGVKKPIPRWMFLKIPFWGSCPLGTGKYRYYGIVGFSRAVKDWYAGGFMGEPGLFEADYLLDLKTGVWWHTGKVNALAIRLLEGEYAEAERRQGGHGEAVCAGA